MRVPVVLALILLALLALGYQRISWPGRSGISTATQATDWVGASAAAGCQRGTIVGAVSYVRDGDTIELDGLPIRLQGLAAPEWDEPGGERGRSGNARTGARPAAPVRVGWRALGRSWAPRGQTPVVGRTAKRISKSMIS